MCAITQITGDPEQPGPPSVRSSQAPENITVVDRSKYQPEESFYMLRNLQLQSRAPACERPAVSAWGPLARPGGEIRGIQEEYTHDGGGSARPLCGLQPGHRPRADQRRAGQKHHPDLQDRGGLQPQPDPELVGTPPPSGMSTVAVFNPEYGTSVSAEYSGRVSFVSPSVRDATIVLEGVGFGDIGSYTCKVATFPLGNTQASTYVNILVEPKVYVSAGPTALMDGANESLVATCIAERGRPAAEVFWETDLYGRSEKQSQEESDGTTSVHVRYMWQPQSYGQGRLLTCVVRHPALQTDFRIPFTLNVHFAPVVSIEGISQNWYVGQEGVRFDCGAKANPPARYYTWIRSLRHAERSPAGRPPTHELQEVYGDKTSKGSQDLKPKLGGDIIYPEYKEPDEWADRGDKQRSIKDPNYYPNHYNNQNMHPSGPPVHNGSPTPRRTATTTPLTATTCPTWMVRLFRGESALEEARLLVNTSTDSSHEKCCQGRRLRMLRRRLGSSRSRRKKTYSACDVCKV
ncbi:hypothetical protein WMY93_028225 [Mugilogobius chulae]|uniref:Nectin cell adhesion molecule 3 n=1 Tax=Mugilogobius chulae TaxID=88201 RepID=A0AAW0MS81_9GOBI